MTNPSNSENVGSNSLENVSTAYALMYGRLLKSMLSYAGTDEIRSFDTGYNEYTRRMFPIDYTSMRTSLTCSSIIPPINDLRFLQKHEGETRANYERRVLSSFFYNAYRETVDWQVGRVFSREIQIPDDDKVPEVYTEFCDDVDGQGTNLNSFCQSVFRDAVIKGFSSILVDFESASENETMADSLKRKPIFNHVKPENIIAAYTDDNGQLYHLRIMHKAIELNQEKYEEECVSYITLFKKTDSGVLCFKYRRGQDEPSYEQMNEGSELISLPYIPLITFYACAKEDDFLVNNVLNDLADLNISHYRQMSSYLDTIDKTAFPMLLAKGFNDDEFSKFGSVDVGSSKGFSTTNENASLTWVEYAGTAVESAAKALDSTEKKMAVIGSDIINGRPGTVTATQTAIESAQQNSRVESLAKFFQDFMNDVMSVWSDWMMKNGSVSEKDLEYITVNVYSDFSFTEKTINDVKELREMVAAGLLSRQQYIDMLRKTAFLGQDFDAQLNEDQLSEELDVSYMKDDLKDGETDTIEEQTLKISAEDAVENKE